MDDYHHLMLDSQESDKFYRSFAGVITSFLEDKKEKENVNPNSTEKEGKTKKKKLKNVRY